MTVATKAAGFAGLLRVFILIFPSLASSLTTILWVVAAASMIFGNVAGHFADECQTHAGLFQHCQRRLYLDGFCSLRQYYQVVQESISSALFYLLAYALTSFSAWAVMIALEPAESDGLYLQDFSGLGHKYPWLGAALLISMLSFTGVPLTMGFLGQVLPVQNGRRRRIHRTGSDRCVDFAGIGVLLPAHHHVCLFQTGRTAASTRLAGCR